jgi:hypothetical protein
MRRTIRVENFYEEDFVSDDSDYAKAEEVVQWILSKFMEIPPEYKSVAEFRIKQLGCGVGVEFVYKRLETDEEERYREEREKKAEANYSDRQLSRLKKLATKYGYTLTQQEKSK